MKLLLGGLRRTVCQTSRPEASSSKFIVFCGEFQAASAGLKPHAVVEVVVCVCVWGGLLSGVQPNLATFKTTSKSCNKIKSDSDIQPPPPPQLRPVPTSMVNENQPLWSLWRSQCQHKANQGDGVLTAFYRLLLPP